MLPAFILIAVLATAPATPAMQAAKPVIHTCAAITNLPIKQQVGKSPAVIAACGKAAALAEALFADPKTPLDWRDYYHYIAAHTNINVAIGYYNTGHPQKALTLLFRANLQCEFVVHDKQASASAQQQAGQLETLIEQLQAFIGGKASTG